MENDKKWEKPEITIIFSGNVNENVMWGTSFVKSNDGYQGDQGEDE